MTTAPPPSSPALPVTCSSAVVAVTIAAGDPRAVSIAVAPTVAVAVAVAAAAAGDSESDSPVTPISRLLNNTLQN